MKRSEAREKALQAVFQIDLSEIDPKEAIENVLENSSKKEDPFLLQLVLGTVENMSDIDVMITDHLENWTLNRLGAVDRTILRIAVYEIMYEDEIPVSVSMDEAIELAKKFGDDKSSKFINAVLSKVKDALSK
ncbi:MULTISPECIES: transcription antitermination factor NusB [Bacillus]|uniref:transcription antitermination factor NusB n=1 Tax=Bacillus TaxID=1386 RepID=UPI000BB7AA1D|nr:MULTISPECIES: transcription antitermination factor NusB [Bacillus]